MEWCNGFWGFPWFGIVFLVVLFFWILPGRRNWNRWNKNGYQNSAEDILAEKYAKGELTEKEYKEKLEVLRKHGR